MAATAAATVLGCCFFTSYSSPPRRRFSWNQLTFPTPRYMTPFPVFASYPDGPGEVSDENPNPSYFQEDLNYTLQLGAGSVAGAALVKDSDSPLEIDSDVLMDSAIITAPSTPIDVEPSRIEMPPRKRRRRSKKSVVWEHFTVENIGPGHAKANCKYCNRSFAYITRAKLAGTSHLKRHISLGICPGRRNTQLNPTKPAKSGDKGTKTGRQKKQRPPPGLTSFPLDQERCTHELVKIIILYEYPIHIVENPGFINLVRAFQPQYSMVSFNSVQDDIVEIYLSEKQKLLNVVTCSPGHVSLTLDLWTSNQTIGYVFLYGQFLDSNWNLHRRLLNVVMIPDPDSENALYQAVVNCISDWCLDSGIFTLTFDESLDTKKGNFRGLVKNPLVINGQLVVTGCFAHVLTRLSQEAIESMAGVVQNIRDSVKYVKTSESNNDKFDELKQDLQVPSTKEISLDDPEKWNTTYIMLVSACELKEVFACFDASDTSYKLSPSVDDWKQVETLCSYLKLFFDAATTLTSPVPPTTNFFFHEVSKIQLELAQAAMSQDPLVSNLARPLQEKFDNYWRKCCLVLAIAVVMDPRFKMKLVESTFQRIYGDDSSLWITLVNDGIHELYNDYSSARIGDLQEEGTTCELDQYLEESLMPQIEEFDVLIWWKGNNMKYPTLSKMAADILSVPVSTVSPGSVFDTKRRLDSYRSSLRPPTLEALICARDWLLHEPLESSTEVEGFTS